MEYLIETSQCVYSCFPVVLLMQVRPSSLYRYSYYLFQSISVAMRSFSVHLSSCSVFFMSRCLNNHPIFAVVLLFNLLEIGVSIIAIPCIYMHVSMNFLSFCIAPTSTPLQLIVWNFTV